MTNHLKGIDTLDNLERYGLRFELTVPVPSGAQQELKDFLATALGDKFADLPAGYEDWPKFVNDWLEISHVSYAY